MRRYMVTGYRYGRTDLRYIYAPDRNAAIRQAKLLGFRNVKHCIAIPDPITSPTFNTEV